MNYFRTAMLLAGLTGLFMGVGFLIGGGNGAMIALLVAGGMNLFAYWNSDRLVLSMHGAQQVDAHTAPDLHAMVAALSQRAGLPMPKVYLMDNPQPNAFATGRNPQNSAVAVTTGLLRQLNRDEVAGVIAHELAHIANRDTLLMTITATIAGAISMLGNFAMFSGLGGNRDNNNGMGLIGTLAMVILAPLAAMLVQMAISRTREYAADNLGAQISGEPWLWPRPWPRFPARRIPSRTKPPSTTRRPPTCSSSTRCRARAWTICSRPIRRPGIALPRSSNRPARPGGRMRGLRRGPPPVGHP